MIVSYISLLSKSAPAAVIMLGASFLPARLRHEHQQIAVTDPGYVNRQITHTLQIVARSAFTHPIHTIVFIALLASTSYVGILEGSLSDHASPQYEPGRANIASLVEEGRQLQLGPQTSWKWRTDISRPEAAFTV